MEGSNMEVFFSAVDIHQGYSRITIPLQGHLEGLLRASTAMAAGAT
jgi:hypothetical protein